MSQGEEASPFGPDPRSQLQALLESDRKGIVDGVEFDFRHPSIPVELWHSPDAAYGVDFRFPSECEEADPEDRTAWEDETPWVQAEVGDAVSIAELRRFDRHEGPLADLHDTEEWWAHLHLTRGRTGERIHLEGVMAFVPRDALGPHSPHILHPDEEYAAYVEQHHITFDKIRRRIARLIQSTSRREPAWWVTINGTRGRLMSELMLPLVPPGALVETGWVYERTHGPAQEWLKLADDADEFAFDEIEYVKEQFPSAELEALVDTVAAAAYALARAECELRVAPLAKTTLKAIKGGAEGGKRRAQNRREWVARNWEPHALELAKSIREKAPGLGQTNLAAEIVFAWTSAVDPPGHDWTLAFVRRAERQGLIPRRERNGAGRG
ncbi:hypothetical protein [uncultured Phenylobacterium sp.]|uniref:hypothetical protein n=1 Tax=uncultured Phenylobacterium sp. TaxID=349273 RepID=UPI0025DC118A|nr:hypothetical protein [uncultured Phenylobacterium sp.]